ncbi:lysylphosphatidylglycerol synthase transmembrane domain-containing protein [Persephonella sp.]
MKKKLIRFFEFFVSVAVSIGFVYLFYVVIGFEKFISFFSQINPVNILLAFTLYTGSYLTRAFRWKLVLSIKEFKKLFKITAFNTVFNIFLPFRTGELSFFYMLKKENIPFSESAISFFSVRVFDAISLFAVFGFSFFLFYDKPFLAFLTLMLMPFSFFLLKAILSFLKYEKIKEFHTTKLTPKNITILYLLSVFTFFLKFTAFYLVLPEGVNLSFVQAFFASSAGDLTTILPIHGIAGIGTYEGGYAGILILFGVDKENALLASVFVHLFMLLGAAVIAAFSYVFLRK